MTPEPVAGIGAPGLARALDPADLAAGKKKGASDEFKSTILGESNARLYRYDRRAALDGDRTTGVQLAYEQSGPARSNVRYGYVLPG